MEKWRDSILSGKLLLFLNFAINDFLLQDLNDNGKMIKEKYVPKIKSVETVSKEVKQLLSPKDLLKKVFPNVMSLQNNKEVNELHKLCTRQCYLLYQVLDYLNSLSHNPIDELFKLRKATGKK